MPFTKKRNSIDPSTGDYLTITPLHNGVVFVDADTTNWGSPKTDQSVYNFALIKHEFHTIERRPGGNFRVELKPNTIVFVRPGEVEQVDRDDQYPDERVALSSMVFNPSLAKDIFHDEHLDGLRSINDPVAAYLLQASALLDSESYPLLVDHLTMAILHRIRGLRPQPEIKSKGRIERALIFINDHLNEKLTLGELAGAAAMSSFHFVRTFRQVTGMTPLAYVTSRRIDRAKVLIANTNFAMAEIALMCGFSSQSHFSATFKSASGLTPRQHYMISRGGKTTSIVEAYT